MYHFNQVTNNQNKTKIAKIKSSESKPPKAESPALRFERVKFSNTAPACAVIAKANKRMTLAHL